jgi:hypothetical protein
MADLPAILDKTIHCRLALANGLESYRNRVGFSPINDPFGLKPFISWLFMIRRINPTAKDISNLEIFLSIFEIIIFVFPTFSVISQLTHFKKN